VGSPRAELPLRLVIGLLLPVVAAVTRREWSGQENIPQTGGVVLCTNHVSHVDPFTFAHFVWRSGRAPRFLAKEELFRVPLVGRIIRAAGQIPVQRESAAAQDAFRAAVAALRAGEAVCVYPEATLTRDPELWPMKGKTGAARLALETGAPVVPIAQWGPQNLLAPYARRPRLFPRAIVHVVAGPPVDLCDLRGRPVSADVLHLATERILDAITALLAEVRGESAPAERVDPAAGGAQRFGNPRRDRRHRRHVR
jgi:1-acyl-sn-glycerol-3-phosphate acyltransferase